MWKISSDQISEIFLKARIDARELIEGVSILKRLGVGFICIAGILCMILVIAMFERGFIVSLITLTLSLMMLFFLYFVIAVSVASVQVSVHLLNSNLALLSVVISKAESSGTRNDLQLDTQPPHLQTEGQRDAEKRSLKAIGIFISFSFFALLVFAYSMYATR